MKEGKTMATQQQRPSAKLLSEREVLSKAVVRAAQNLQVLQVDLAQTIGVSESTASRLFANLRKIEPGTKEAELVLLFLRMYRSLNSLFGGEEPSRKWFHAQNYHLGGVPAVLVKKVEGLVNVTQYLDAMRGKT
jgi:Protein of unknown function (DUF2384)